MKTFSYDEYEYLEKLKERNSNHKCQHFCDPLTNPITPDEKKLRTSISEKCDIYMYELALAQYCGVLPSEKMKKCNFQMVYQVLDHISWGFHLKMA